MIGEFVACLGITRVGLEHFKAAVACDVGDLDEVRPGLFTRESELRHKVQNPSSDVIGKELCC
jgi:hypothetical protein